MLVPARVLGAEGEELARALELLMVYTSPEMAQKLSHPDLSPPGSGCYTTHRIARHTPAPHCVRKQAEVAKLADALA